MTQLQEQNNIPEHQRSVSDEMSGFWARTKLLYVLIVPLVVLLAYAFCPWEFPQGDYALDKMDVRDVKQVFVPSDRAVVDSDSIRKAKELAKLTPAPLDTTRQRILFFGDSMVEGLAPRLADYAMETGHEYWSVCWYSSTSEIWCKTDTLEYYLKKAKPTFVIIALCSNEQFVKDLSRREKYVDNIVKRLGNIPYVWIGPPTWKSETGINEIIQKRVGENRYFESRNLKFRRGRDHVHPTFASAAVWMDSIAVWLQGDVTPHPIQLKTPTQKRKRKWNAVYLTPFEL